MMNRRKLFIGIVLAVFAIILYDCTPKDGAYSREKGDFAFRKATRSMFGDTIATLDAIYGQGKFSAFPLGTAFIDILPDTTASVRIGDSRQELKLSGIPSYLAGLTEGLTIYRCVILLDRMGEKDLTANGLTDIKPLLEELEANGIRSIVTATQEQSRETYYSTYKYARIYALDNGSFVLDHNGLEVCGDIGTMIEWVTLLDIEYVAYYPDDKMTWTDASRIMSIALERGSRTFFVCEPMAQNKYSSLTDILATIQNTGNGEISRKKKGDGMYRMAVLPTRPESTAAFKGHTMHEVLYMLTDGIIDNLYQKAVRVIDKPEWFYAISGGTYEISDLSKLIFCEDQLVMVCSSSVGRNVWIRPDNATGLDSVMFVVADGKRYRMTGINEDTGLKEFAEYPWKEEYSYANGSLCWVPEGGEHTWMYIFEPVPADAVQFDIVAEEEGMRVYLYKGVKVSDKDDRFDDVKVFSGFFAYDRVNINGAYGPNEAMITRIESGKESTRIFLNVIIRSTFTFPDYVGSDFTLTFNDGTRLKMTGAEGVPLDTEFNRGGDHMEMNIILEFPPFDITKLRSNDRSAAVLQGDICHTQTSLTMGIDDYYLDRQ